MICLMKTITPNTISASHIETGVLSHNYKKQISWIIIIILNRNFVLLFTGFVVSDRYLAESKRTEEGLRISEEKKQKQFYRRLVKASLLLTPSHASVL